MTDEIVKKPRRKKVEVAINAGEEIKSVDIIKVGIAFPAIYEATKEFIESTGEAVAELVNQNTTSATQVKKYDLIIFTGGSDINPYLYGEQNTYSSFASFRDNIEMNIFRTADKANIPMFGICRGLQLINVLLGGSLYQDLFQQTGKYHTGKHTLQISNDNIFSKTIREMDYTVNSMHHQGIKHPGNSVRVSASYNGIPEIIYSVVKRIYAVQFHPEFMSTGCQKLFANDLISWVKRNKSAKVEDAFEKLKNFNINLNYSSSSTTTGTR